MNYHLQLSAYFFNFVQTSARMAKPELINSISILSRKIENLIEQQKSLTERVFVLEQENQILRNQHKEDLIVISKAQKEIEFLSMSHRLANSPEALISARNKISQLIRTIDSCIRIIKED